MGDVGDELAVDLGEDGFLVLAARDEQVGEGIPDGVGDVFEREVGFRSPAGDRDVGDGQAFLGG